MLEKRLTYLASEDEYGLEVKKEEPGSVNGIALIQEAVDLLGLYEDTGVTPEEIMELQTNRSEPCEFCRDSNPEPFKTDEINAVITQITPFPSIDLGTGKRAEKADNPYYAIMVTAWDGYGIEELIPIQFCPRCGRRLVSTRTYESLVERYEKNVQREG